MSRILDTTKNGLIMRLFYFVMLLVIQKDEDDWIDEEPQPAKWNPVPDIDLSTLNPSDFNDDELDLPYYLKHLHTVANAVIETGANRGFIGIRVYRSKEENVVHHSRIMDNILSFVWFYCSDRSWNSYYNSSELKVRIEAGFDFLCNSQRPSGLYPHVDDPNGKMSGTAFVTKFMGQALVLLSNGPSIDENILQRAMEAQRKAIMVLLDEDEHYERGIMYSNQYTNVFAGALAYLFIRQDAEMEQKLKSRIEQSATDFQSAVGFFRENYGTDHGYNLQTHHSNLWMAYNYSRGTDIGDMFVEEEQRYSDWINYNAVLEPDGITYTLNRGIDMRQKQLTIPITDWFRKTSLGEEVEAVRAYLFTQEELMAVSAEDRQKLEKNWPNVPELKVGSSDAYDPYNFLHRSHHKWYPSLQQKQASIRELPYISRNRFIHQKRDNRNETVYTFIRQPGYYAAFNSGKRLKPSQRMGLGLLWNPGCGSFFQTHTDSDIMAWGTKEFGAERVFEAYNLYPTFTVDGQVINPEIGAKDLPQGILSVKYSLGSSSNTKTLTFKDGQIDVDIKLSKAFTEFIPLLVRNDDKVVTSVPGEVTIKKGNVDINIKYDQSADLSIDKRSDESGDQRILILKLSTQDFLKYSVSTGN